MRGFSPFIVLLLLLGSAASSPTLGQEGGAEGEDGIEPGAPSPQERVTELVRQAMRGPERREVWAGLALSLSEMDRRAREEGKEATGMEEAVRIAYSLAFSGTGTLPAARSHGRKYADWNSGDPAGLPVGGSWLSVRELGAAFVEHPLGVPGALSLVLVGLLFLLLRARRRRIRSTGDDREAATGPLARIRRKGRKTRDEREGEDLRDRNPWTFALALWESGLPPSEVAQRTGLAQDTLAVLLNLQGGSGPTPVSHTRKGSA